MARSAQASSPFSLFALLRRSERQQGPAQRTEDGSEANDPYCYRANLVAAASLQFAPDRFHEFSVLLGLQPWTLPFSSASARA